MLSTFARLGEGQVMRPPAALDVRIWHLTDVDADASMSAFRGKADMRSSLANVR